MKKSIILTLFCGLLMQAPAGSAAAPPVYTVPPPVEAAFDAAKGTAIGGKQGERIRAYMLTQAQRFKSIAGATVSTIRDGEIIKVSIPADKLFAPNDTTLIGLAPKTHKGHTPPDMAVATSTPAAPVDAWLRPVLTFMRKGYTRLIITSHTDDTGSATYLARMAEARARAVDGWMKQNGVAASMLSTFAFADAKPLYDNDSMLHRAANRRITFYLVPNEAMIKEAKKRRAFQD